MQRRLLYVGVGAVAVVAAVALLRSQTPTVESVVAPDGQQLSAYHDPRRVEPPNRPEVPPRPPGELQLDQRRGGALVSWTPAPFGFEVRWGRAGGPLDSVSYQATSGTTLRALEPGRYRVEVRSVDSIGQRSTPSTAEFEASDRDPPWMRGLGFAADFSTDMTLDPVSWRLSEAERRCLRSDSEPDPVLLIPGSCQSGLRPAAQLRLGEPDRDGVRGRVVVVTDAPQSERLGSELVIAAAPVPTTSFSFFEPAITDGSAQSRNNLPSQAIAMRVTGTGVGFELGSRIEVGDRETGDYQPPASGTASPGALHRWELVFKTDSIEALRNGYRVASARATAPWSQAQVNITTGYAGYGGERIRSAAQVSFVGLTGKIEDPRPVKVLDVDAGGSVEHSEGAIAARLTVVAGRRSRTPAQLVAEVEAPPGSQPAVIPLQPLDVGRSAAYAADLPPELVGDRMWIAVQGTDSEVFFARLVLELTYPEGADLGVARPEPEPLPAVAPRVALFVRSPETGSTLTDGERTKPEKHNVRLGVYDRSSSSGIIPWVALRADLDGRRILTMPTATGGPAMATKYEFVLDLEGLPDGEHTLEVWLVPDRSSTQPARARISLRVES